MEVETEPILRFGPSDLEGVTLPHNDTLVVRDTIADYNVA